MNDTQGTGPSITTRYMAYDHAEGLMCLQYDKPRIFFSNTQSIFEVKDVHPSC